MHPTQAASRKQRTLRVSELFYSIEGEGPLTGFPTVFLRLFGCNFTCSGFNNPDQKAVAPIRIERLEDFVPTFGCDSIYAWHPSYKHLVQHLQLDNVANEIRKLLPGNSLVNPTSNQVPILSLTGGEPTLHQRPIIELLNQPAMQPFSKLLIETNCAVNLTTDFLDGLNDWVGEHDGRSVIWSNSPKLSISGERYEDAIRPDILAAQAEVKNSLQYFKFVSDGSERSFFEIKTVLKDFFDIVPELNGCCVYVMPVGATTEEQDATQLKVAEGCLTNGFNYCARVHCTVFKNSIGT